MPRSFFLYTAVFCLLAGCASVPDLGQKPAPAAAAALDSQATLADQAGAWPVEGWWQGFGDPQLDALIDEGLAGSPDIAVEALAQQAGAALLPHVGVQGSAGGVQQSKNMGIPPAFVPDGIQDTGSIAATFGFDLDLWGKNRAALAAATSEAEAARVDAAQARLMLTTGIATAYADLAGYYADLDVAQDAIRIRGASADLSAKRTAVGLDNQATQRQAESRAASARGDVAAIEEAIALTRNRLAALPGCGPKRRRSASTLRVPPFIRTSTCRRSSGSSRSGCRTCSRPGPNMAMAARRSACRSSRAGGCRASIAGRGPIMTAPSPITTARSLPRCAMSPTSSPAATP